MIFQAQVRIILTSTELAPGLAGKGGLPVALYGAKAKGADAPA